jgi:beta-lactam-binding protein with PASTA domain
VIGQDYWDAEIMLEAEDFVVKIAYRPSTDMVLDKVIDQVLVVRSPDEPVMLWVSSGPEASASVLLPNVVSLTEDIATRDLESFGFPVQVEKRSTFIETDDAKVLDESPSSLRAPFQSTVVLTVGQYQP